MQNDNFQFDKQRQSQGFVVRGFLDSCGEAGSGSDSDLARTWEMASLDWNCLYVNVDVESWHYHDMITTVSCNIFICLHVLLIYHARSLEAGLTELGRAVVLHAWLFQMILRCLCEFFRLQVILHLVFGMVLPWDSQFCEHEKTCLLDSLGVDSQFAMRARHFWRWRWSHVGNPKSIDFHAFSWCQHDDMLTQTWMQAMATTVEESTSRSQGSQA